MFKKFGKEDRILHERPFLDSEVPFNVIHKIAEFPDALLLHSEDRRIIIAQSDPESPIWIWTDPKDTEKLVHQLLLGFGDTLRRREGVKLVGTPEFLETFILNHPCVHQKEMVMAAYACSQVRLPQGYGRVVLAAPEDRLVIAAFCAGFLRDALGRESTWESQLDSAEALIRSGGLYVLEAADGIVAMANIAHRSARHARINQVYTPPAHRKKGYASMLVAELSRRILLEDLIPVLYTDLTNETSNKVYQELGYHPCGKVDQYQIWNVQED